MDDERCWRAVQSRDTRFDGWSCTAVRTTGTCCRPSSPAPLAAGFGSVRQCNDTVRAVFACTPTQLRAAARGPQASAGRLVLRPPFRRPLHPDTLFGHLAATAVPGVEEWRDGAHRRTLRLDRGPGVGPWTVEPVAMRALGDPDAFLPTDLGVVAAARPLGVDDLVRRAERWAPWCAHAVQHLWGTSDHPVHRMPEEAA